MRHPSAQRPPRVTLLALCLTLAAIQLAAAPPLLAQAGTIVGRVTDQRTREAVPSVAVTVDGTRLGATTGPTGLFRIVGVPAGMRTLSTRRLGYLAQRATVSVTANGETTADFLLLPGAASLDQIIVTGTAGDQQLRSIGNAVSTIDAANITATALVPNVSSLLNGRASGVTILERDGRLGVGPSIQIRGRSSMGLDNSPLLYIDGVRVNNATATGPTSSGLGGQGATYGGRLNDIDPDDIESIEIIKGPAAATIYGTEAANGVVQIITKKGAASGRGEVALQVQDGTMFFRDAANRIPTNYVKDATGTVVAWNGVQAEAARGTPIFTTGQTRRYAGTAAGTRDQLRYYLSAGYENDNGVEPNNALREASLHTNLDLALSPKTDLSLSVNLIDLSEHLGSGAGVSVMLGSEVGHPLLFPGGRGFYPNYPPEIPQQLYDNADGINRFTTSLTLSNRPVTWFSQRAIVGMDYTGEDARGIEHYAPPELAALLPASAAAGRITQTLRRNSIITADYSGSAKFSLRPTISSTSTLGGQFYKTELNASVLAGTGFPAPGVETVSATATQAPTQTQTINTTIGGYGEQQFGWRDRLFVTAGLRVDNNSAFGQDFKWVTYPKVAGSWVVSEEPFWHWSNAINSMRLRAAFGESGRQPAAFSALRTFTTVTGPGGVTTVTPNTAGNADLRPELSRETELGFESAWFSRLTFNFTYFTKRTKDEIVSQNVAPSSGFPGVQLLNLGEVTNHGIEIEANLKMLERRNVTWEMSGSLGTNKDVIVSNLPTAIPTAGQYNVVGYPIGGIFTRHVFSADRDPTTGLATNVLCDGGAGTGVPCATAPFLFTGTPTPKMTGSVGNTITIGKRLTLYGLVDFKRGHRVYNAVENLRCTGALGAPLCYANYYPLGYDPVYLAEATSTALAQGYLDQYYQDASFVKLREISAVWQIPERWFANASRMSLTLAARELHTWTNYRGPDPEVNNNNPATSATTTDQALLPPLTRLLATFNIKW